MPPGAERRAWPELRLPALVGVLCLSAFDLLWRLDRPDWHFDEVNYAYDGWDVVYGRLPRPDHPLLGKYLIGFGQLLFGRNLVGVRLLPVLASLAATLAVFALGRRINGWWTGVVAAALWAGLPRALMVAGETTGYVRADRYALLDTVANAAVMAALLAGWWWVERPSTRRAALVGVAVGVAAGSKLGALVVVGPIVVLGLLAVRPWRRAAEQTGVLLATAAVLFFLPYAPFGRHGPGMFSAMLRYQRNHAQLGHITVLDGSVWSKQPWWANPANWLQGQGIVLVGALVAAGAAAWWARDRLGVAYLWVTVLAFMGSLALSPVALTHSWTEWLGPLLVLAAVGVVELVRRRGTVAVAGFGLAAVFAVTGGLALARIASAPTGDYGRMAADISTHGDRPQTAVVLGSGVDPYFPGVRSTFASVAPRDARVDLVVIERQFAVAQTAESLAALRDQARRSGLAPHVRGDVEYWYRAHR